MKKLLDTIAQEYENNGELSNSTLSNLRECILNEDPYSAISIAADCRAISLAPEIAKALESNEIMVRGIAISTLLSRFKLDQYAVLGLHHAQNDSDEMVKGAAISGLGEILPIIADKSISKNIASLLVNYFENEPDDQYIDYREDAYEGILAAMNISPLERPPANKALNFNTDIDTNLIKAFRKKYLNA